jgi:sulfate adenylyltransferase
LIAPHGGSLVEAYLSPGELLEYRRLLPELKKVLLDPVELSDLELLSNGAYSPLDGFMGQEDYHGVVSNSRLHHGPIWTIPITLSIPVELCSQYRVGETLALMDETGDFRGILQLEEIYHRRRELEAIRIFGTLDRQHPGVNYLFSKGELLLGGKVKTVPPPASGGSLEYCLPPRMLRCEFDKRGWKSVAVFEACHSICRAHEYLQKEVLSTADGLLIHPLAGLAKPASLIPKIWTDCCREMAANHYPMERVMVSVFPAVMRFAGSKEAVCHALVSKNYGCDHLIIDHDYAGFGSSYPNDDPRDLFDRVTQETGIEIRIYDKVSIRQ